MSRFPQPPDFFGEAPPERIIGTERECLIQIDSETRSKCVDAKAIRKAGYQSASGFLNNGANIGTDVCHIEVRTANELGPQQAAAADEAAKMLVTNVVEASGYRHGGVHGHSATRKGTKETTHGRHENYLFPRFIENSDLFDTVMMSFLTSRTFAMSGMVRNKFELSQKVSDVADPPLTRGISRRMSVGNKPMATIPSSQDDRDIFSDKNWARLEVRFSDAGFSPTINYLSFAATSLVLRMIEHESMIDVNMLKEFSFKHMARAAKTFNKDLTFTRAAETVEGARISALNYQEMLADTAEELNTRIDLPDDELVAISLWHEVIDEMRGSNLAQGEYGKLLYMTDFAPLHKYLHQAHTADTIKSTNKIVNAKQLMWYRIDPEGGAMTWWRNHPSPYVSWQEIVDCLYLPPPTSGMARGDRVAKASKAIWSAVEIDGQWEWFKNPYDTKED